MQLEWWLHARWVCTVHTQVRSLGRCFNFFILTICSYIKSRERKKRKERQNRFVWLYEATSLLVQVYTVNTFCLYKSQNKTSFSLHAFCKALSLSDIKIGLKSRKAQEFLCTTQQHLGRETVNSYFIYFSLSEKRSCYPSNIKYINTRLTSWDSISCITSCGLCCSNFKKSQLKLITLTRME